MPIRTFNEIAIDFITNILRVNEKIDVSPGQVIRDAIINPVAQEMETLYAQVDQVRTAQSLVNANIMSVSDLNNLVSNFGVRRNPASPATGEVTFYTTTQPLTDITIPAGTRVSTTSGNTQVVFVTTNNVRFLVALEATYFNPNTGYWELNANVQCEISGLSGNVGPFTVNNILNANLPFRVVNRLAFIDGISQESNNDLAIRTLNSFTGNNKGTKNGYLGTIESQQGVFDALVVGPNDILMERDGGFGGKVDIWTLTPDAAIELDSTTDASLGIQWDISQQSLKGYRFDFPKLPVDVESVLNVVGSTSPDNSLTNVQLFESRNPAPIGLDYVQEGEFHYTFFKSDDLNQAHSVNANDFIIWNPITLENLRTYPSGTNLSNALEIDITYSYNSKINELQTIIDEDSNKIITADVLVKEAKKIILDIQMNVVILPAFKETPNTEQQTINSISTAIVKSINSLKLGQKVQESDLIQTVHNVAGVDNIILNTILITRNENPVYGVSSTQVVDIQAGANEYFEAGQVNITSV